MDHADARWTGLTGGYKTPYDPRPALRAIEDGRDVAAAWAELWNDLHHQGDIGGASYAAVVALAGWAARCRSRDWNVYALAAIVESARLAEESRNLPAWLVDDYAHAWTQLFETALAVLPEAKDEALINSVVAVLAAHKGQPSLARMAILNESERRDMLDEVGWA